MQGHRKHTDDDNVCPITLKRKRTYIEPGPLECRGRALSFAASLFSISYACTTLSPHSWPTNGSQAHEGEPNTRLRLLGRRARWLLQCSGMSGCRAPIVRLQTQPRRTMNTLRLTNEGRGQTKTQVHVPNPACDATRPFCENAGAQNSPGRFATQARKTTIATPKMLVI